MNPVTPSFTYVDVLRSETSGHFNKGCTGDLQKRFKEHNNGESSYTKSRGPYNLIFSEACANATDAYSREKYFKSGMGKKYIRNRIKRFLGVTG